MAKRNRDETKPETVETVADGIGSELVVNDEMQAAIDNADLENQPDMQEHDVSQDATGTTHVRRIGDNNPPPDWAVEYDQSGDPLQLISSQLKETGGKATVVDQSQWQPIVHRVYRAAGAFVLFQPEGVEIETMGIKSKSKDTAEVLKATRKFLMESTGCKAGDTIYQYITPACQAALLLSQCSFISFAWFKPSKDKVRLDFGDEPVTLNENGKPPQGSQYRIACQYNRLKPVKIVQPGTRKVDAKTIPDERSYLTPINRDQIKLLLTLYVQPYVFTGEDGKPRQVNGAIEAGQAEVDPKTGFYILRRETREPGERPKVEFDKTQKAEVNRLIHEATKAIDTTNDSSVLSNLPNMVLRFAPDRFDPTKSDQVMALIGILNAAYSTLERLPFDSVTPKSAEAKRFRELYELMTTQVHAWRTKLYDEEAIEETSDEVRAELAAMG